MVGKMLKIVKRNNKRRGRNITIGAVVGLLLSCTAVMKADEIGTEIKNTNEPDYEYINDGDISVSAASGNTTGIHVDSSTIKNIINNGTIDISGPMISYGIYLKSSKMENIVNNGNITGSSLGSRDSYGIYLTSIEMGDIINNGNITGSNLGDRNGSGIYLTSSEIGDIINNGNITGFSSVSGFTFNYGISLNSSTMGNLVNNGNITGSSLGTGYGIYLGYSSSMRDIINSGTITGLGGNSNSKEGYGIYIYPSSTMGDIINSGNITSSSLGGSYGIYLGSSTKMGNIANSGNITSSGSKTPNNYGIYLKSATMEDINNSGNITGSGLESVNNYGMYLNSSAIGNIFNNGNITGSALDDGHGYGISFYSSKTIGDVFNNGSISGSGATVNSGLNNGYGISLDKASSMGNIINNGNISGSGSALSGGQGYGIRALSSTTKDIINKGVISGAGSSRGFGIYNYNSTLGNINNLGVIYGTTNALFLENGNKVNNYGILAAEKSVIDDNGGTVSGKYMGLAFKINASNYEAKTADFENFGKTYKDEEIIIDFEKDNDGNLDLNKPVKKQYTIINAKANGTGENNITGTESLKLENGTLSYNNFENKAQEEKISLGKNYILNGITNTLLVSTGDNKLNNSIINAYGTAVKFDTAGELTLSGTIVNGGIDRAGNAISGSDNGDTLILQSGETGQNTVINGNINMEDGNDILTIGNGTIINGALDGGAGSDILNFGTALKTGANTADEINIRHDISGFENLNINTNVTLFETIIDSSGNPTGLTGTVTGADSIAIGKDGVLILRININDIDNSSGTDKIKGHALYGNTGTIYSTDGGKLLLALNGAGNENIISFGTTELDNSLAVWNTLGTTSKFHTLEKLNTTEVKVTVKEDIPEILKYEQLNKIYQSILSVKDLIGNFNVNSDEKLSTFLGYLNDIYAGNPYSYSSELSRKSMGMFRDIIAENQFKADTGKWMIYGGLTHIDGGNKDTYYGKGYYTYDIGSSDIEADTKITGAYILGEYGVSDTLTSGVIVGGNKLKSDLSNGSKVDGDALYIGGYVKKYAGNLKVTAGAGLQYGDYDIDRAAAGKGITETRNYSSNYNDMSYDIYLNGRYSHNIGDNLFLEPYGTLSYTYIKQDSADEGNKTLAIETDSKSFDYTSAKVGVDLKKVISHEKGKSTLSAGVSYTRLLNGADEEYITGRFKGGKDFDILVAHKNEHSIGLNAKYALELENGVLFDVKGTYAVERDSNNNSGKNKTKGEWIIGAGLGYKF